MKNTELPARRTARAPGREHAMKARLLGSLVIGVMPPPPWSPLRTSTGTRPWPPSGRQLRRAIRRSPPSWRPGSPASP